MIKFLNSMNLKARKIAYGLAIFVLMNALFVVSDAKNANSHANDTNNLRNTELVSASQCRDPESSSGLPRDIITAFKQEIRQEFARAFVQTVGDQPFMTFEVAFVFNSVNNFYGQASDQTIALLDPKGTDDDIVKVGREVYLSFVSSFTKHESRSTNQGQVAGEDIEWDYDPISRNQELRVKNQEDQSLNSKFIIHNSEFMTEEPIWNIVPGAN